MQKVTAIKNIKKFTEPAKGGLISKIDTYGKIMLLGLIIMAGLVFYLLNATKSGLWYDEAIEFYYSKYMTGTVPGGCGTVNMLERCLRTFQPPLYNILMFFWLKIFDSEFTFRLAGILTTMFGTVGIFLAVDEINPRGIWSNLGALFYLFTPGVVFYGLECGEYNLMLCMIAWTVYFHNRIFKRNDLKSILGFIIFSCLSVYSQYGAAFIVLGMYITAAVFIIRAKKRKTLKQFAILSVAALFMAAAPLITIYLIPQMNKQGSLSVSHQPFFGRGLLIDFTIGFSDMLASMFGEFAITGILIIFALSFISLFVKPKQMIYPFITVFITWVLYFVSVCCSVYGFNFWNPDSIGSSNLGGKYSFFFIPCLVVLMSSGISILTEMIKEKSRLLFVTAGIVIVIFTLCFCATEVRKQKYESWNKDEMREAYAVWYDHGAYRSKTLVHQLDDALFNFYLEHDSRLDDSYNGSIESADLWIRSAGYHEMKDNLEQMGYLSADEYYFLAPVDSNYDVFLSVVHDAGYETEVLFDGKTKLYSVTK